MYRPATLNDIVGQTNAKKTIEIVLKSAKIRKAVLPHICMCGPPGTGKTTFSKVIAQELKRPFFSFNGSSFDKRSVNRMIDEINGYMPKVYPVVFIDECHSIPNKICETLYTALEDFEISNGSQMESLNQFTFIGATTDYGSVPKPMRDRLKVNVELEEYTVDELLQIGRHIFLNNGFKSIRDDVLKAICKTCRFNPRNVVTRCEFIRDYFIAEGKSKITKEEVIDVISLQGYDNFGLTMSDRKYLNAIAQSNGGTSSLSNISSKTNISEETIKEVIEPFLIKINFISIEKSGRKINRKRYNQYLSETNG